MWYYIMQSRGIINLLGVLDMHNESIVASKHITNDKSVKLEYKKTFYNFIKRLSDIILTWIALIVLSPILPRLLASP